MSKALVLAQGFQRKKGVALSLGAKFISIFFILLLIAGGNVLYLHSVLNKVDGVAETVNIAGKLRMLSQKIALQAVFSAHHRGRVLEITKTQHDFETALSALENGGEAFGYGIRSVPPAFKDFIVPLRADWLQYRREVEALLRSDSDSGVEFDRVAQTAARILTDAEVLVGALTVEAKQARRSALFYLYLFFIVEACIFGVLIWVSRRRIVIPLIHLANAARALAGGDYQEHIKYKSHDEIGHLVDAFNFAAQRIGLLVEQNEADRAALLAQKKQLEYLANHDALTGLPNRTLLDDRIAQAIAQAKRNGAAVALLMLDLDHFKTVNDGLGHDAGDLLLQIVAEKLAASIRDGDTIARFGGDEFVVLMPNVAKLDDAAAVAAKIHHVLSSPDRHSWARIFCRCQYRYRAVSAGWRCGNAAALR